LVKTGPYCHAHSGTQRSARRARAVLGKINRDLDRLVQALIDGTPARTVKDRMAQLEARKEVLEAQLAQGEDVKVAVHPSMASRGYSHGPEGDRDAIGDVRLDRRPWAMDDPDFVDRLVTLHPRRRDDRARLRALMTELQARGRPGQPSMIVGALLRMLAPVLICG
jgi:hypothetical protein